MKKLLKAIAVAAALSATVSCACSGNSENVQESGEIVSDAPECMPCDSTSYWE